MRARALVLLLAAALAPDGAHAKRAQPAYGAVAYHRASQSHGYAYDFATPRAAAIEALKSCGHAQCEVFSSFHNACGAVADGTVKKPVGAKGATPLEAQTKALRACTAKDCAIVAWACTR
jgi:hypothetical protein